MLSKFTIVILFGMVLIVAGQISYCKNNGTYEACCTPAVSSAIAGCGSISLTTLSGGMSGGVGNPSIIWLSGSSAGSLTAQDFQGAGCMTIQGAPFCDSSTNYQNPVGK